MMGGVGLGLGTHPATSPRCDRDGIAHPFTYQGERQCDTTEVSTPHFLCVVYQDGGPNSARLWCDHGSEGMPGQ